MTFGSRFVHFFFMHLGSLVAIITYFHLCGQAGYSAEGVRSALLIALFVKTGYMAVAAWRGYWKQLDVGVWLMFAVGTVSAYAGIEPVLRLYQTHSPTILFTTLGTTAILGLVVGPEPFTYFYTRRQVPRWQLRLPVTDAITRLLAGWWTLIFFGAAALTAWSPRDPLFTALYPNLLVVLGGLPAASWLPRLYLRLFPPGLPQSLEPLLMSMPFVFNREAAGDVRASIQFCVSGAEAGDYHLRIADGQCQSFEGRAAAPDLTVHTPDTVWMRIAHGQLDGGQALSEGQYRIEGDVAILAKMESWFRR